MPVLRINAVEDRPEPANGDRLGPALDRALGPVPPEAPIIVLVHGYSHSPFDPRLCPHQSTLSPFRSRRDRHVSWARHLGYRAENHRREGLAIAFGWHAIGSIWQAYGEAARAGRALARLTADLAWRRNGPVQFFAHSLGARVALAALRALPAGAVGRAVFLAGAEFRDRAEAALARPGGRQVEVLNVTSRENALFDAVFERLLQSPWRDARALGAGLADAPARWLDLAVDDPATRYRLSRLGLPVAPPSRRVCHRSGYLRPGLFPLYRRFLAGPEALPLDALRSEPSEARDTGAAFEPFGLPQP